MSKYSDKVAAARAPEPLSAVLAETRKSLVDDSWIDEITALDEDGEPDDFARRVVPLDDALEAIDRIDAATKNMRAMLDANVNRVRALEAMLDGAANTVLGCAIKQKQSAPGNAAAIREALEKLVYRKCLVQGSCGKPMGELCTHTGCIWHPYRAALSAPARNVDRFKTAVEAEAAWMAYPPSRFRGCRVCPHGDTSMVSPSHLTLAEWLFAPAAQ